MMTEDEMFELAAGLGEAKGRQDASDALTFMHQDMLLISPAWGTRAKGKAQNSRFWPGSSGISRTTPFHWMATLLTGRIWSAGAPYG